MVKERYIAELKKGHERVEEIFSLLREIINEEQTPDMGAAVSVLDELRGLLVAHVKNEDDNFYPVLRRRAVELGQEALLPSIDLFAQSMHAVTKRVEEFFGRYSTEADILGDIEGFKVTLLDIIESVEERMKSEEGSLFYIYRAYFPEEDES